MDKSDLIISINRDPQAEIFNISNMGFVGDCATSLSNLAPILLIPFCAHSILISHTVTLYPAVANALTPVEVAEGPGFVVNRILIPMINEACFIYQEGLASVEDIDAAMKLGANHPMGPLALGDLIGLDIVLDVMEVLYTETAYLIRIHHLMRNHLRLRLLGSVKFQFDGRFCFRKLHIQQLLQQFCLSFQQYLHQQRMICFQHL